MNWEHWRRPLRNERVYLADLEAFVTEFIPWTIRSGFEPALELTPSDIELMQQAAEGIARRMVTAAASTNARSWRAAVEHSMHGRRIFEALKTELASEVGARVDELVAQNAKLILGLPEDLARRTATFIAREQQKGRRSAEIAKELQTKLPAFSRIRTRLIARTEVSKAETAVTQARAERLGLRWYEWATSEDQRVRPSHRLLDKVLVAWTDAPSPEQLAGERSTLGRYHAGGAPNCRCLTLPLVWLDEIQWPHKIYFHNRIEWMNRSEFERWNGLPQAA